MVVSPSPERQPVHDVEGFFTLFKHKTYKMTSLYHVRRFQENNGSGQIWETMKARRSSSAHLGHWQARAAICVHVWSVNSTGTVILLRCYSITSKPLVLKWHLSKSTKYQKAFNQKRFLFPLIFSLNDSQLLLVLLRFYGHLSKSELAAKFSIYLSVCQGFQYSVFYGIQFLFLFFFHSIYSFFF